MRALILSIMALLGINMATSQEQSPRDALANSETMVFGCTNLTLPLNGATNVPVDTDLRWAAVVNAVSYDIRVGTTTGGEEIFERTNVGNVTFLDLPMDLPIDRDFFVTIFPRDADGNILEECEEERFSTRTIIIRPLCTALTLPEDGDTGVPVDTDLNWAPVANATSYLLRVGTSPGGDDISMTTDVGNVTSFDFGMDLPLDVEIWVSIIPFNALGNALGCVEERFITGLPKIEVPDCTSLLGPADGVDNVPLDASLSWAPVEDADGYRIRVGTTREGSQILPETNVEDVTRFTLSENLPPNTEVFVQIIPFNSGGDAVDCNIESFRTEEGALVIPDFFTPNGDTFNDTWVVSNTTGEPVSVAIFDRLGKLLFQQSGETVVWDGRLDGRELPSSSYWYRIDTNTGEKPLTGFFLLKR